MINARNGQGLKGGMSDYYCGKKSRDTPILEESRYVLEWFLGNYGVIFYLCKAGICLLRSIYFFVTKQSFLAM
jgi:hypothetical protein